MNDERSTTAGGPPIGPLPLKGARAPHNAYAAFVMAPTAISTYRYTVCRFRFYCFPAPITIIYDLRTGRLRDMSFGLGPSSIIFPLLKMGPLPSHLMLCIYRIYTDIN